MGGGEGEGKEGMVVGGRRRKGVRGVGGKRLGGGAKAEEMRNGEKEARVKERGNRREKRRKMEWEKEGERVRMGEGGRERKGRRGRGEDYG